MGSMRVRCRAIRKPFTTYRAALVYFRRGGDRRGSGRLVISLKQRDKPRRQCYNTTTSFNPFLKWRNLKYLTSIHSSKTYR